MEFIPLAYVDLLIGAALILADAALALAFRLGIARSLLIAAARMTVQLLLIGLVLEALFDLESPWLTGLVLLAMGLFAGREIAARQDRRFTGPWTHGLGGGTILLAASSVTLLALTTQLRPEPWWEPRYAIPLFGMILGNAMNGISLGLNALVTGAERERASIDARLALGADRWQATNAVARQALRTGFMPIVNAMSATGLVFLPGMMTGQILGGVPPAEAVKYQLMIMFLIAGATGLGTLLAVTGGVLRLTDERHRLRLDRLKGTGLEPR